MSGERIVELTTEATVAIFGLLVAIVSGFTASLSWLFKLEGRVNTHQERLDQGETLRQELRADIAAIREGVEDLRGRK